MKHIILILTAFALAITALHASDPVIVVNNVTSVTVDGTDYGKPADAIANNKQLAPAIQLALEKWAADLIADKATAEAERNALKARISTVLNTMLTEELKTGDGPKAELLRKLIAESQKSDADLKREALSAEIAAKQAELQKLTP
jgi:hypothetical protein